jgi:protein involved in sex pheromone biosynthesis
MKIPSINSKQLFRNQNVKNVPVNTIIVEKPSKVQVFKPKKFVTTITTKAAQSPTIPEPI